MITASATVLAFLVVAWLFVLVTMLVGKLVRRGPTDGESEQSSARSALDGESEQSSARSARDERRDVEPFADERGAREPGELNFDPRFFVAALVFLIFDVALAFIYPVAVVFKRLVAAGHGGRAFGELFTFVGVLFFGLAYLLKKGDLDWIRGADGKR